MPLKIILASVVVLLSALLVGALCDKGSPHRKIAESVINITFLVGVISVVFYIFTF